MKGKKHEGILGDIYAAVDREKARIERRKKLQELFEYISAKIANDIETPRHSASKAIQEEPMPARIKHVTQLVYYRYCEVMDYTPDKSVWDTELDSFVAAAEAATKELGEENPEFRQKIVPRIEEAFEPLKNRQIEERPKERQALESGWEQFKGDAVTTFNALALSMP